MRGSIIRIFAIAFILFIIAAVIIADRGQGAQWWPFIDKIPFGDKLGHIGLFGTLSFLCNLAFPGKRVPCTAKLLTKTTLILLILISLEELSQAFFPTRTLDLFDWLADLLGLALGQTAALLSVKRLEQRG